MANLYKVKYKNWIPIYYVVADSVKDLERIGYATLPSNGYSGDCEIVSAELVADELLLQEGNDG